MLFLLKSIGNVQASIFDVKQYGAKANADITQALTKAWKAACASTGQSKVVVPGGTFMLGVVPLEGPCKGPIELQVIGTLQAPEQQSGDSWHVTIKAPETSVKTDGIHIGRSTGIHIIDTNIGTRDDCVSLGDGSRDITVEKVNCGPGHGISIGSLGKFPNEEPIPSRIKISNVSFINIRGTSKFQEAVKLVCSKGVPCEKVELRDIDLKYNGHDGSPTYHCINVKPTISGKQNPPACTVKA
nr:exopolygalacturonase [Quercus suber]POE76427.1 exopolygalacturonase [Quercus suber]